MTAPRPCPVLRLDSASAEFHTSLHSRLAFEQGRDESISKTVQDIVADVQARGDQAVLEYTARFDRLYARHASALELSRELVEIYKIMLSVSCHDPYIFICHISDLIFVVNDVAYFNGRDLT